jgi:hypothetical protein
MKALAKKMISALPGAPTLEELEQAVFREGDPAPAVASAAPGWAETTVRWLRQQHPAYCTSSSGKGAAWTLKQALMRMSFSKVEADKQLLDSKEYQAHTQATANAWSKADHLNLIDWLERGGHTEDKRLREAEKATLKEIAADEDDHVASEEDFLESVDRMIKPRQEQDLADVLNAQERDSNPDSGGW